MHQMTTAYSGKLPAGFVGRHPHMSHSCRDTWIYKQTQCWETDYDWKVDLRKMPSFAQIWGCLTSASKHRLDQPEAGLVSHHLPNRTCCVMTASVLKKCFKWLQTRMGSQCGGTCVGSGFRPWMAQLGALSPLQTEVTGPPRSGVV